MVEQLTLQLERGGSNPTSPLQLFVRLITKNTAALCYRRWHYLGDKGFLQVYGFGAYYDGLIHGAISFHPPSAPETVIGLFGNDSQDGIWEIGRLAMSPDCPRNSESRFIAVAIRLLRRATPVKAIITYADSSVGHTGIIYRASGFIYLGLTAPKKDFWVDSRIQERGKTHGINGEWRDRPRKHKYIKTFEVSTGIANIVLELGSSKRTSAPSKAKIIAHFASSEQ